jgi:hypothetical protein
MDTVNIRDLRGAALREHALRGELLAITNHRVLIGIVIPAVQGWVEHLITGNWRQVSQSITEAEKSIADGEPMTTIADVHPAAGTSDDSLDGQVMPLIAAVVDGTLVQAPQSREAVDRWRAALNPPGSAGRRENHPDKPSMVRTVRIGDLSAGLIEEAGSNGQTLAITHDRELIGMVIPVTQNLVQYLIEKNISRVLADIELGEKQLKAGEMTHLDTVVSPEPPEPGLGQ